VTIFDTRVLFTNITKYTSIRPTFWRIWKKGAVEQYSPIPYVATLLNCLMWVLYGLPAVHPHSMLVITINGMGTAIELTYITLFLLYSAGAARRKVLLLLAAEVAFVGAVAALVLTLAHTHERRSMVVGILCVLFGTGMYAAPLSVMVRMCVVFVRSLRTVRTSATPCMRASSRYFYCRFMIISFVYTSTV
jgi:solute carrier family 50 (sugar transporter)